MITASNAPLPARILVVDDEPHVCNAVARALNLMGYETQEANTGYAALQRLNDQAFDLMLLDMRMPEMDGIDVMRRAHQQYPDLLILVLTGHATLESAIAAVKSGAVDYLLKPVVIADIALAVDSALRSRVGQLQQKYWLRQVGEAMGEALNALRQAEVPLPVPLAVEPAAKRFLQVGSMTLDRSKRLLIMSEEPSRIIELSKGEALVLALLMECPDQVLSCRQLVHTAWGYELDERESQSVVRPYIFRLRQKIEIDPEHPHVIQTVRGSGYLFQAPRPAVSQTRSIDRLPHSAPALS
jgi:DNA-binding response OmpR family regulator